MTPEPPDELPPGQDGPGAHAAPQEADYEVIRLIGRGGYGEVWLVQDKSGNYRACKVVYRESFQHDRPYEREYQGICKFEPVSRDNESQLKVLHVGRRDALGYFYYLMELADDASTGQTIDPAAYSPRTLYSEMQQRKKLSAAECIQIGLSLSAALENLHQHGLIHRDIKPGNIVFVNGVPKLADIGLVTDLDVTISYVGTEGFIPPEGPTSAQADIYGLGKVLYEISTGNDRLQYPELPANFAEIPDWELLLELNAIVTKACETSLTRRYASAKDLHADLALLAAGKSVRRQLAVRRRWRAAGQIAAAIVAIGLVVGGAVYFSKHPFWHQNSLANAASSRMPMPDAGQLAQDELQIQEKSRGALASGTADAKQRVAADLYNRSQNEPDPAMELASLRVAAGLAIQAGDFQRAMDICDRIDSRFQTDILPFKADLLSQAVTDTDFQKHKAELVEICMTAGFTAIAADDYVTANKIAELARTAAQQTDDAQMVWQSEFLSREAARCAGGYERVKRFAGTLHDSPMDGSANLAMGKFICFDKNDWATGLPLLARGNDDALKAIAIKEINSNSEDAAGQLALGDSWWDASATAPGEEKNDYQKRARYWYLMGIAASRPVDRTALHQKYSDRIKAVPLESAELHLNSRVAGTEFLDIYSDEVQWRSSQRGAIANQINQVHVGDLNAGDVQIIKNSGSTRFMPDAVDFATATLGNDRSERHREHARLTVFDDHVHVLLSHQSAGSADLDVTLIFGGSAQ